MSKNKEDSQNPDFVALIENPYGLNNTDIVAAQASTEPLELEEFTEAQEEMDAIDISALAAIGNSSSEATREATREDATPEAAAGEELTYTVHSDDESAKLEESDGQADDFIESDLGPIEQELAPLDETQLERLSGAIDEATAETLANAAALQQEEAVDSEAELAAQIAEDQEIERQLAAEAEQTDAEDEELNAALPKAPVAGENGELDLQELESCLEALLFMSDKPLSVARLRELLGPDFPLPAFQEAMTSLADRYKSVHHGFELVEVAGGFQFRTKPGRAALAKKLAKVQTQRLSSGGMESLAIIAYKQPVLKDDIDKIRGVDSSYFIRGLLDKKLIQISGRSDLPGRPMLYTTTQEFLEVFGLKDLSAMPPLHEVEKMVPASQTANPDEEDPRVKEMRRLVDQMKTDTSTSLIYNPREDEKILKEIRERVNSIPVSTPYLEMQKELEKQAAQAAQAAANGEPAATPEGQLLLDPSAVPPAVLDAAPAEQQPTV